MIKRIKNQPSRTLKLAFMLGIIAFLLYLPGFWWGAPHMTASTPDQTRSWGTDDLTPLGPLSEMHNIIEPKTDRNLGYPLMHPFIVSAAYAPYLGFLWIIGDLNEISAVFPFGLENPAETLKVLTYIAHFVSVLMGVGIVVSAFYTGKILKNERVGVVFAILVMVSFPMFYYARTGNVDVPMQFFMSLSLLFFARILKQGFTIQNAFYLGLFGGSALATKEQAFAVFLAIPFILIPHQLKQNNWRIWNYWKPFVVTGATLVIVFGFGSGLFVRPERYFAHLEFSSQRVAELMAGELIFMTPYPNTIVGNLQLITNISKSLLDNITLAGLVLAIIGLGWTAKNDKLLFAFSSTAAIYLAVIIFSTRTVQLRYFMPPAYILAFYTAVAGMIGWDSQKSFIKIASRILLIGIVGISLLRGIELTNAMVNDSRYLAAEWLESNTKQGDQINYFGIPWKLPPLPEGVEISPAIPYFGGSEPLPDDPSEIQAVIQNWEENPPDYIIIMPDYTSEAGSAYSGACPPTLCEGLLEGKYPFELVKNFASPVLFPWLRTPALDYPTVNPPTHLFRPKESGTLP